MGKLFLSSLLECRKFFKGLKIMYLCLTPFRCKDQQHASEMIPEDS